MPTLFTADQVARSLGLSASGLRKLSVELAPYLSPSAQGRGGGTGRAQRRYTEADLETLRTARGWLTSGATYPEVRRRLSEIRPPAPGGTVEPPRAETPPEPPPVGTSETALALDSMRLALAALRTTVDAQDQVIELQRSEIARLQREVDALRAAPPSPPPSAAPPPTPSPEMPRTGESTPTHEAPEPPRTGEQPPTSTTPSPEPPVDGTVETEPPTSWWDRIRRAIRGG